MYILGISFFYHESAACIIKDGEIIAASAEERFSRIKHDASFPTQAVAFCLNEARIVNEQVDYVVFYEKPFHKFHRNIATSVMFFPYTFSFFIESIRASFGGKLWVKEVISKQIQIDEKKILFVPHHLSHAAAAFYPSPFQKAAFLTIDGIGEWTTTAWGVAEGSTLKPAFELRFPHSIGLLYSTFTAFLGFEVNDGEYKVMGMAAFGKPRYVDKIKKLYRQFEDGSVELNLKYFSFYKSSREMFSQLFEKEFSALEKCDIAASLQYCVSELIVKIASEVQKKTGLQHLVYGGGVALNSVSNAELVKRAGFKDVFIFPAAGDDGGAVGAALYVYHHVLGNTQRKRLKNAYLGKSFSEQEIEYFLQEQAIPYKKMDRMELADYIALQVSKNKVVGWFEGKAEFGPRALGHRSILADARNPSMKDLVNKKIKFREEFRPFAPMILQEKAGEYFKETKTLLTTYMLQTCKANPVAQENVPAIVHIDRTSRVQIVSHSTDLFYALLKKYEQLTHIPVLLNTSFNLKGEPIVNSPEDAYKTFIKSGLDILVLERFIIEK
jgi:carbamoyltransferase